MAGSSSSSSSSSSPKLKLTELPAFALVRISTGLEVRAIKRLSFAAKGFGDILEEGRPELMTLRKFGAGWPWCRAHSVEQAVLFDDFANFEESESSKVGWKKGPNRKSAGNDISTMHDNHQEPQPWLKLTGGTDWQGFQGVYQTLNAPAPKPRWVAFQVAIQTLELSCGFLALSSGKHNWGLQPLICLFGYRGDDGPEPKRRFKLQSQLNTEKAGIPGWKTLGDELRVEKGVAYDVAFRLDWSRGRLTIFIDGQEVASEVPFQNDSAISCVGLYNWRSGAESSFSSLTLGDAPPHSVVLGGGKYGPSKTSLLSAFCPRRSTKRRLVPSKQQQGSTSMPWLLAAVLVLGVALFLQFFMEPQQTRALADAA